MGDVIQMPQRPPAYRCFTRYQYSRILVRWSLLMWLFGFATGTIASVWWHTQPPEREIIRYQIIEVDGGR